MKRRFLRETGRRCVCVHEVAYTAFRGQRVQRLLRDAFEITAGFLDNDFPKFYQLLLGFWRKAGFSVIQILEWFFMGSDSSPTGGWQTDCANTEAIVQCRQ